MKIYLGADHGGFKLKEEIKGWLATGHEVVDLGASKLDEDDDFIEPAVAVAEALEFDREARGILLCRNGVGVAIVANRYGGVRCALGFDPEQTEKARSDDDVNCLSLPADYLNSEIARNIVQVFLKTKFSGEERYRRRLEKLEQLTGGCGDGCCGGGCC